MLLQWELGQTIPVLFSLADKKRLIVSILHSATKYAGEFRVENHHAGEAVAFVGEHTERRDPMLALINSVNLKNPRKEKMVPKDDTEVWEYYEYLENYYKVLNPGSLTAEERNENFKLSPLTPTHIWTRIMVPGYVENMGRPLVTPDGSKRKITKGTRQKNTATTAEPTQVRSNTDHKKSINRPVRCGNHHVSIKSHGEILRRPHEKYTRVVKRK